MANRPETGLGEEEGTTLSHHGFEASGASLTISFPSKDYWSYVQNAILKMIASNVLQ